MLFKVQFCFNLHWIKRSPFIFSVFLCSEFDCFSHKSSERPPMDWKQRETKPGLVLLHPDSRHLVFHHFRCDNCHGRQEVPERRQWRTSGDPLPFVSRRTIWCCVISLSQIGGITWYSRYNCAPPSARSSSRAVVISYSCSIPVFIFACWSESPGYVCVFKGSANTN